MEKKQITTEIEIYEDVSELPAAVQHLMQKAKEVRANAYAPYSQFLVGAALLLSNGEIVSGSNQENSSYPSGLCAERTAIYAAGANFPNQKILQIAITAGPRERANTVPVPPCGACRQAIAEYEQKQKQPIEVYFMGKSGKVCKVASLLSLLPLAFDRHFL
ncbi:cytidine deaminase [Psychroflexus planctonicus]|uniref:Cytidine deaminase n=1 Tax=Psychroflexus planctonicus TaxID=1526575 RepID=A0ABQ1SBR2_9FLAO|nr:cytidine deaminase [Psychroflexus planctonicus]GGE24952.1 cytidine deaminase [Psychroflexus planctonicus]